jgi:hypothetical protein
MGVDAFAHLNYYETLGLDRDDLPSKVEIKEAFLRVSKITHPDNSKGLASPIWFSAATRARDALLHDRHAYDSWLDNGAVDFSPQSPNCNVSQQAPYSAKNSEHVQELYFSYLKRRSWLLFFLGSVFLYLDWFHPTPALKWTPSLGQPDGLLKK